MVSLVMRVENLFNTYYVQLVLYVFRMVKIKSVAEDIVQDTFLKVLEQRNKEDINIQYLYVSVKNQAINYLRDTRRLTSDIPETDLVATEVDPETEWQRVRQLQQIHDTIETLPLACRQVFKQVYFEKRKYADVARELGVSVNTIRSHMYTAMLTLKKKLT